MRKFAGDRSSWLHERASGEFDHGGVLHALSQHAILTLTPRQNAAHPQVQKLTLTIPTLLTPGESLHPDFEPLFNPVKAAVRKGLAEYGKTRAPAASDPAKKTS